MNEYVEDWLKMMAVALLFVGTVVYGVSLISVDNRCPLAIGDSIRNGIVKVVEDQGKWTSTCKVGILYADGRTEMVEAWRVVK